MTGNFGSGYTGFKTLIDMVAEGLGGDQARESVAHTAEEWLVRTIQGRLVLKSYDRVSWTKATDLDFDEAVKALERVFAERDHGPVLARASFKGGAEFILVADERQTASIYLRGGGFEERVITTMHRSEHNYRTNAYEDKFNVYLSDDGARIASGSNSTYFHANGSVKSANVKTPAASFKSARSLLKNFFNLDMIDEPKT